MKKQTMPRTGEARQELQRKGQFWTPDWVAEAMVEYVLKGGGETLFDPAVGPGTFFVAAKRRGFTGRFSGCELHNDTLEEGRQMGLLEKDLADVRIGDFLTMPLEPVSGIVSNPPYIRHHRIAPETKEFLQQWIRRVIGIPIDGRAGLHVYFFIRCLQMLKDAGHLAFIVSADICEGVFAKTLWAWVTNHYCLDGVITFAPEAAPFPDVDTNALIFLLCKAKPKKKFLWARVMKPDANALTRLLTRAESATPNHAITVAWRDVSEGIRTGLSRPEYHTANDALLLKDVADVMRGIATGANEFFALTSVQIQQYHLPTSYFVRCIGRTRDCPDDKITLQRLAELETAGRPTWLLDLPNVPLEDLPVEVQKYLQTGVMQGLSERALIKSRRRWYRMEQRKSPPLLFAYLGRRSSRFILNEANILPLTGFLCVYPKAGVDARSLWRALNEDVVIEGLSRVGKSYGNGAIKVEPRALEQLTLPRSILIKHGIRIGKPSVQLALMESRASYKTKAVRSRIKRKKTS